MEARPMPFTAASYPAYRAAFLRAWRARKDDIANQDRTIAHNESLFRPTEYIVRLRMDAAHQRLVLTPAERRILFYDRRFIQRTEQYVTDDGHLEDLPFSYERHLERLSRSLGIRPERLLIILDMIERLLFTAEFLAIPVDTTYQRVSRLRHARPYVRKLVPTKRPSNFRASVAARSHAHSRKSRTKTR
jgi:hypothetical protein